MRFHWIRDRDVKQNFSLYSLENNPFPSPPHVTTLSTNSKRHWDIKRECAKFGKNGEMNQNLMGAVKDIGKGLSSF